MKNAAASNAGGPAVWGLGVEWHPHVVRTQFYKKKSALPGRDGPKTGRRAIEKGVIQGSSSDGIKRF